MGGFGSGRHGGRAKIESYLHLDVRWLHRQGYLYGGGAVVPVSWTYAGQPSGSIVVTVGPKVDGLVREVVLSYRSRVPGGEWEDMRHPVALDWTPCTYGGHRPWFVCHASGHARRVAILYGGDIFACRDCHRLAYGSQRETRADRMLRKADKICVQKLHGAAGCLNDPPDKPKGMHWSTYNRLVEEAGEAADRSVMAGALRLGWRPA